MSSRKKLRVLRVATAATGYCYIGGAVAHGVELRVRIDKPMRRSADRVTLISKHSFVAICG